MSKRSILLLLIGGCCWLVFSAANYSIKEVDIRSSGKDYALFFAIDDYAGSPDFGDLRNPIGDAEAIALELSEMYAFETHVYKNKDKAAIFEILRQWRERTYNTDDQLFIFFSGHGDFYDFTAKGYFIAHGNRTSQDGAYIDLSTLRNIITQIPCEHILLAIDACYSGTIDERIAFKSSFRDKRPGASSTTERDRLIGTLLRNNTRLVVTSGGKERTPDGTDHSPFANAFLRGLRAAYSHEDGLFTYNDLLGHLDRVSPKPHTSIMNGHKEGSFVFVSSELKPTTIPDDFARIEGGIFEMGDTFGEGTSNEKPVHTVEVSTFYMSKHEVTFAEYDAFSTATGKGKPSDEDWGRGQRPVINVSWCDAVAYANWLSERNSLQKVYSDNCDNISADWNANGYRLPTEAEWEYAARNGGQKVRFGNGKNVIDPAEINFNASESYKKSYSVVGQCRQKTVRVGSLNSPNSLGLHDMSGNVYEWCWDWYGNDYYKKSPRNNPQGAESSIGRVLRGGDWNGNPRSCRAADRYGNRPSLRLSLIGFRLARS